MRSLLEQVGTCAQGALRPKPKTKSGKRKVAMDLALDELIDCVSDFVVVAQLNVELEKVLVGE